jgi:hypothetical protein
MNIPQGFIEIGLVAVVGFVFRVVFGLISKNEIKSDEADLRLEVEIKEARKELHEAIQMFRMNDKEIFAKMEILATKLSSIQAQLDCVKGKA